MKIVNKFLAQMAANTIKGNNTGSSGNPLDLTATQVTAMLNNFTTSLKGLVPGSGGGTTNFLRADGTWAAPPSGGGAVTGTWTLSVLADGTNPTFGTNTQNTFFSLSNGIMDLWISYNQSSAGTGGSGRYFIQLPPGYAPDSTKLPVSLNLVTGVVGTGTVYNNSGGTTPHYNVKVATDGVRTGLTLTGISDTFWPSGTGENFGQSSARFSVVARLPVVAI